MLNWLSNNWDKIAMLIPTIFMAVYACFSWKTAKQQKESQEELLKSQNEIQKNQYNLTVLKDMLESVEEFRQLVLDKKEELYNQVYVCVNKDLKIFRTDIARKWSAVKKISMLFGKKYEYRITTLFNHGYNILSPETYRLSDCGIFKNGFVNNEIQARCNEDSLKIFRETQDKNTKELSEYSKDFSDILDELYFEIETLANRLKNNELRSDSISMYSLKRTIEKHKLSESGC
jgi:hypothetical protein